MCCGGANFLEEKCPLPGGTLEGCRVLALPITVALGLEERGTEISSAELVPGQCLGGRGRTVCAPGIGIICWGIDVGHGQLRVTWVSQHVPAQAELPLLLTCVPFSSSTQLSQALAPCDAFCEKKPAFCLMQKGDNFIRPLVSMSLAPLGLFATTSVTMSCVIYPEYLYQKYRNNNLIPLCWAFWFNLSLHWVVFPLIIWYFMKTSCCGVRHHSLIFWYSAPDSCH